MRKYKLLHGILTPDNIEQFTEQLKLILTGKLYTFVAINETVGFYPQIRVNQYLDGRSTKPFAYETFPKGSAENIALKEDLILVCSSYGVASISMGAYFEFHEESRYEPERVVIDFKGYSGTNIVWIIYPTGDIK